MIFDFFMNSCPHCSTKRIKICRITFNGKRLYFGKCTGCQWCGETRSSKRKARQAWNQAHK